MSKVYKKIEVVGTSAESISDAVDAAVRKAAESLHGLCWFEVAEIRGRVEEGVITEYQAAVRIGFRL